MFLFKWQQRWCFTRWKEHPKREMHSMTSSPVRQRAALTSAKFHWIWLIWFDWNFKIRSKIESSWIYFEPFGSDTVKWSSADSENETKEPTHLRPKNLFLNWLNQVEEVQFIFGVAILNLLATRFFIKFRRLDRWWVKQTIHQRQAGRSFAYYLSARVLARPRIHSTEKNTQNNFGLSDLNQCTQTTPLGIMRQIRSNEWQRK